MTNDVSLISCVVSGGYQWQTHTHTHNPPHHSCVIEIIFKVPLLPYSNG